MCDLSQLWERLDALLRRALDQLGEELPVSTRELVIDFIDNREYEVALDWMSSVASASGATVPREAQAALDEAAKLMGL